MTQDRPLHGLMLIIGFSALAPLGDGIAKLLGDSIPLGQLLVARFGLQALFLSPLVASLRLHWRMSRRVFWLVALRSLLHVVGIGAMFTSLRYLPLADALAIAFVMPFILLLLGRYLLHEEIGARRLIACLVGFIGTLMVIQPSFVSVGAPALLPLLVALAFALFMMVTRQIAKETDPIALQAVSGAMALVILLPIVTFGYLREIQGLGLVVPSTKELWLLASIGVLGTIAHLLMTWSLRFAPAATLAPVQYLEIPFATLIGWLLFSELPNGLAALGIAITIGAGLFVVLRERAISRRSAAVH